MPKKIPIKKFKYYFAYSSPTKWAIYPIKESDEFTVQYRLGKPMLSIGGAGPGPGAGLTFKRLLLISDPERPPFTENAYHDDRSLIRGLFSVPQKLHR
jgi:hypothetical protein